MERKSKDLEKTEKHEDTEICVGEALYNEVQAWVKKEIGSQETPAKRKAKKKTYVPIPKNQPKLSQWFTKEGGKEQAGKSEEEKVYPEERQERGSEKNANLQETWKEEARQTDEKPVTGKDSKTIQQDIRKVLIKDRKGEKEAAGETGDVRVVEEREERRQAPTLDKEEENRSMEEEDLERLISSINSGNPQDKLVQHWLCLTKEDFRTLQGSEFINDKIIDSYMNLIQQRSLECPNLPRTYACTTFFFTKLKRFGVEEGTKQTRNWFKEDLREMDVILCPVHRADHWSLVAIDTRTKTVNYLDSLQGSRKRSPAPGIMKKFIEKYYREKGEQVKFKVKVRKDAPVQENGFDCGVFTCKYAERESKGERQNFKQKDLVQARNWMTRELMKGKLNPCEVEERKESTAKPEKKKMKSEGRKQDPAGTARTAGKKKKETKDWDRRERESSGQRQVAKSGMNGEKM